MTHEEAERISTGEAAADAERLARQARIHARAVEVIAGKIRQWGTANIWNEDSAARELLAELSHHGLLVGTADEFKE